MTFRTSATVLMLAALACGVIVYRPWLPSAAGNGPPGQARRVLKVPRDTDWKSVREPQVREWLSYFDTGLPSRNGKERVVRPIETLVADGETVVTEGYESEPGVFVFTTISPNLKTLEDGTEVVHVEARSFEFGLSGAFKSIATVSRDFYEHHTSLTHVMILPNRMYVLNLEAKAAAESGMIELLAQGESSPIDPPLPPAP